MSEATATEISLVRRFVEEHPLEAARLLEGLPVDDALVILRQVSLSAAGSALSRCERQTASACLSAWPDPGPSELLAAIDLALAARLLRSLAAPQRERILERLAPTRVRPLRRVLRYAEDTAGALMDPELVTAPDDLTVQQTRQLLARHAQRADYYIYVVDREQRLRGVLDLRELALAHDSAPIGSQMHRPVVRISARADRGAILAHPGWQDYHLLPVVDVDDRLLGVLRYRTLRRLQQHRTPSSAAPAPLGLALAEMYWTMTSRLLQGVGQALWRGDTRSQSDER